MASLSPSTLRIDRFELPRGLDLYHNLTRANPSVVVRALVRAGSSREDAARQGLASLTGRMLRQGTEGIAKDALSEELDGMGAGLSTDVGYTLTAVSIRCLSGDFRRAVEILGEVLQRPTFPAAELERVRGQVLTDLRELEDNTRVVAERAWREMAYPLEHPYHRLVSGTSESVSGLTREQLVAYHRRCFGPNQTSIVVVGDVEVDVARDAIGEAFRSWPPAASEPLDATLPPVATPASQLRAVELRGKTQADVVHGTPAISRRDADYYALAFANHILGRMYFMGRFGEKVRDEQGLAYYAYSELAAGFGRGPWLVRAGVNPRNLDRALQSIGAELDRFLAEGPTEAEQEDGVRSLIGGLPRQLETNEGAAAVIGEIGLYGLGLDFLDRYPDIIRSLTRQQVVEAARRHLRSEAMVTAMAGPGSVVGELDRLPTDR